MEGDEAVKVDYYDGIRISYPKDCGNAPKKIVLLDFYIAFATGNDRYIEDNTSDNITWKIIGNKLIVDKDKILERLRNYRGRSIKEILISNLITHGNVAAVNGSIIFSDESTFEYCDIYRFNGFGKNAKVKEVTSYTIQTK